MNEKPTIAELEALMTEDDTSVIEIRPDGSIHVVNGEARDAKPEIVTLRRALGDSY